MKSFTISTPEEFSFDQCFQFLQRSPRELLHRCGERAVTKSLMIENQWTLFTIQPATTNHVRVTVLNTEINASQKKILTRYIREWFDLETDLKPFYALAAKDTLLKDIVQKHYGYRIIGQPDLFESLVWAVLGQQINLQFAYTLKQRFVENFGERNIFNNETYYTFPSPAVVAQLTDNDLLPLQFSRQKSKYVVAIGKAFADGTLSKEILQDIPIQKAKEILMKTKGIGNWTANYALMKTFRYPDAFPLEDAGIHNAIKNLKKMKAKPSLAQVTRIFKKYKGWEAYATLYLWKSL